MIGKHGKVILGENCFFNHDCSLNCLEHIEIGKGCLFGENVKIYDHNHRFSDISKPIKEQGYVTEKVRIGQHCWIGSNVVILKGATIGDNCVVGAGCVVCTKIEDGMIIKRKDY